MTNTKNIPQGISIFYFNDPSKDIHANLTFGKEQAKKLSRRIFKDAMTAISDEKRKCDLLCKVFAE